MSWKDEMHAAMATYLRDQGVDAVAVEEYTENVYVSDVWGCETCGPEYETDFSMTIYYRNSKGNRRGWHYDNSLSSLIKVIT